MTDIIRYDSTILRFGTISRFNKFLPYSRTTVDFNSTVHWNAYIHKKYSQICIKFGMPSAVCEEFAPPF